MANRIRELRKQNDMTMKQLGEKLGLGESTISQYETGKREPDIKTLLKISECFNVSVDYLMTGKDMEFTVEMADKDSELLFMEKRIKEYALKLSKLSEEDKIQIMNMIDRLGK